MFLVWGVILGLPLCSGFLPVLKNTIISSCESLPQPSDFSFILVGVISLVLAVLILRNVYKKSLVTSL